MSEAMTIKDVLTDALARIRKGWTKGSMARNANDLTVLPESPEACKWCLVGAIYGSTDAVMGITSPEGEEPIQELAHRAVSDVLRKRTNRLNGALTSYNDNPFRTFAEVEALLLATIAEH